MFSHCANMLCRDQNRSQEIKPYLCFLCKISPVYNFLLSSSLSPFHFAICQPFSYLFTVWVVCYLLVLGSMFLTLHFVHCIYRLSSIWYPNTSDKNRVLLSPDKVGIKFSDDCCITRSLMFAEFFPSSLLYQFLERGN